MSDTLVRFEVFNDPMFQQNGRIASVEDGGPCWVIDPGPPPQAFQMLQFVADHCLGHLTPLLTGRSPKSPADPRPTLRPKVIRPTGSLGGEGLSVHSLLVL